MFQLYEIPTNNKHHVPSSSILTTYPYSFSLGSTGLPGTCEPSASTPWVLGLRYSPCVVSHEHFSPWTFFHCELQLKLASSFGLLIKMTFPTMMINVHGQRETSYLGDTPGLSEEGHGPWLGESRQVFLSASWPHPESRPYAALLLCFPPWYSHCLLLLHDTDIALL